MEPTIPTKQTVAIYENRSKAKTKTVEWISATKEDPN